MKTISTIEDFEELLNSLMDDKGRWPCEIRLPPKSWSNIASIVIYSLAFGEARRVHSDDEGEYFLYRSTKVRPPQSNPTKKIDLSNELEET